MPINTDLLQQTLEHIEAHPEEWDQTVWVCGSTACFAGHAVWLSDVYVSGQPVSCVAEELLGLTPLQAAELFRSYNERVESL